MNNTEIEALLENLVRGQTTANQVQAQLVAAGYSAGDAEQAVFSALGGGDPVEIGADAKERYKHSGKLVSEIEQEMARK